MGGTQDIPVQDLIDQLRDDYKKEYARTTVVTFVGKLKDKRFVDTYRKVRQHLFIHSEQKTSTEHSF